jgi:threonine/homoserine/homoserine lactone efflux protein
MTWHSFVGAFADPKLWYLPTAYVTVWVVQAGYLGWLAVQWWRTPNSRG